jgi:hypothetical protein
MRYEEPAPLSRAEAVDILAVGDVPALCEVIISLSLHEPDWEWVEEQALRLTRHADSAVRGVAATALGHLARLNGQHDPGAVAAALDELLRDPRTAGRAEDALSDIQVFCGETGDDRA